ncbi:2-C-methyl-D-erythritol 4-phosphate cytidylyltransferase [Halanaerobium salsuginis]|uniref:2-C-methyl-D-erythritol 4-phosphate cytidylyltransferase n=1 Tax=Halanaerobium salsuginis TaxID=29563 RepID=A0A1I4MH84_9FIRM|nr:2-C-methyl-D-erythritol 4-phosphate cytidylyltransferase [Halanaerobium salsuginis]SFM02621.1 2-C-methyl-D-erythritol 4-phosphate cytidylyltransferase [Halanaerobium salsuginis]
MAKVGVLIAAAGSGSRMGKGINKQFLKLAGKEILYHTIIPFLKWQVATEIIVILKPAEIEYFKKNLLPLFPENTSLNLVAGGKSRKESVNNGLNSFSKQINYVIIHDGARPLVTVELIDKVYQAVQVYNAVSCGVKVKDTIKVVNESFAESTLERSQLRSIQTPQAFSLELIKNAHSRCQAKKALDDASLVEKCGGKVYIVEGDYNNFKITTPDDLKPAELVLKERV